MLSSIGSNIGSSKGDPLSLDVLAKHLSTKQHTWRGKYNRVWALTASGIQHADPADFNVTNSWP